MRSIPNEVVGPTVTPAEHPEAAPEVPTSRPKKSAIRVRKWILVSATAVVALSSVLMLLLHKKTSPEKEAVSPLPRFHEAGLRLKGSTEAIRARAILAPMLSGQKVATLTITRILAAGTHVKTGEVLVEFDRQAQIRDALDKQAEYNKLVDQVAEEQAKESGA